MKRKRKHRTWIFSLACAGALLALSSCAVHQRQETHTPPTTVPDAFTQGGSNPHRSNPWWLDFNDAQLTGLIESVHAENLDLKTAWARLDQFAAIAKQSGALLYPQVNLNTSASRARNAYTFSGAQQTSTTTQLQFNLAASYEIDIWKKIDAARRAALLDYQASYEDIQATGLLLTSQIAQLWINAIGYEADMQLLQKQITTNQTFLELVELRFSQGLASAVDVYQQRQQLKATQAELPQTLSNRDVLIQEMAVLVNIAPRADALSIRETFPELSPMPPTGLPVTLLSERPDIRAALRRIEAADYRIGAAIADRYPTLRLTGSAGTSGNEISDLFDNWIANLAGSLAAPLLDGKRREGVVEQNQARLQELLFTYGKKVQTAIKDVEIALTKEKHLEDFIGELTLQVGIAQAELREARSRYVNGQSDYLPVLRALQSLQAVERRQLAVQKSIFINRIQLYGALGNSWTQEIPRSIPLPAAQSAKEVVQ
jgi:outer membrane protein, multidrug efflux system